MADDDRVQPVDDQGSFVDPVGGRPELLLESRTHVTRSQAMVVIPVHQPAADGGAAERQDLPSLGQVALEHAWRASANANPDTPRTALLERQEPQGVEHDQHRDRLVVTAVKVSRSA